MATINENSALRSKVYNRGRPPVDFLEALIEWGRSAPDEVFEYSMRYDVYSHVKHRLGPWKSLAHRKAVMMEVLRVLGGFESSWHWSAGVDIGKTEQRTACTEEAGIFQCSGNSMNFDPSLRALLKERSTKTDCKAFIKTSKGDYAFALEYCARLLRFTIKHHGPLKRKNHSRVNSRHSSIHPFLSRQAVAEFEATLTN